MMNSDTDNDEGNLLFTDEYKKALEKASHEIVGNHSAVEICGWTKKGLNEESSGCYKQKFYGIRSHQCTQMTPAAVACDQKCVYCWRANEMFSGKQDLMEYAKDVKPNEEVIEDKGVKVLIDPNAVMYLLGTEMDYKKEKFSSQFVFKNPNETERCGCGESFKV